MKSFMPGSVRPSFFIKNAFIFCLVSPYFSLLVPSLNGDFEKFAKYPSTAAITSSPHPKHFPSENFFRFRNRGKSKGAKFGEKSGCSKNLYLKSLEFTLLKLFCGLVYCPDGSTTNLVLMGDLFIL